MPRQPGDPVSGPDIVVEGMRCTDLHNLTPLYFADQDENVRYQEAMTLFNHHVSAAFGRYGVATQRHMEDSEREVFLANDQQWHDAVFGMLDKAQEVQGILQDNQEGAQRIRHIYMPGVSRVIEALNQYLEADHSKSVPSPRL